MDKINWLVFSLVLAVASGIAWGGIGCYYTFNMYQPTVGSTTYLVPTDQFAMSGCYSVIGSPCPLSLYVYPLFYNGTWNNMSTSGNLSTNDDIPQEAISSTLCYDFTPYWTIDANNAWNKNYSVKLQFGTAGFSGNATINVTAPVGDACGTLTASKTLKNDVSSTGTCFTIGANNVVLDCNGYKITYASSGGGSSAVYYGVINSGYNGTTIKNCLIYSGEFSFEDLGGMPLGGKNVYFSSNVWNTTITNNTLLVRGTDASQYLTCFEFSSNTYNLTMTNNTAMLGSGAAYTINNGMGAYLNNVYNSSINNFTVVDIAGGSNVYGINLGGIISNVSISNSNITLVESGHGLYASGTIQNLTISSSVFNVPAVDSGICILGGTDIFVNNITISTVGICISLASTTRALFGNSTLSCTGLHVFASTFVNNVWLRNMTFDKSKISVTALSNVTVQWYARVNVTNSAGAVLTSTINDTNKQNGNDYYGFASLTSRYLVNDTTYNGGSNILYNNHSIIVNNSGYTTNTTSFNWTGRDYTLNITLYASSTSSCTYSGSGNWVINFADRCNITNSQSLPSNTITFNGTSGYLTFGNPTGATLIMTASRFYWNVTGNIYMWFKNSTWFNGSMS